MSASQETCCGAGRTPLPAGPERILCYVTDRRAFGSEPPVGESGSPAARRSPRSFFALRNSIRNAAAAGASWIQIREKDLEGRTLMDLARFAVAETRSVGTRVFVNDRLDVALAAGAAGVHLGEQSWPLDVVAKWRRTAGRTEFQIGVSCHSLESACAAERGGADYVFFGPVFETPSKAGFGAPQGIERLREVCASVKIPVLAIGGVQVENAGACLIAGAAGIAAIRLFQKLANPEELSARLKKI
jgi:thiamine-phosphate pyrophosphorylase